MEKKKSIRCAECGKVISQIEIEDKNCLIAGKAYFCIYCASGLDEKYVESLIRADLLEQKKE